MDVGHLVGCRGALGWVPLGAWGTRRRVAGQERVPWGPWVGAVRHLGGCRGVPEWMSGVWLGAGGRLGGCRGAPGVPGGALGTCQEYIRSNLDSSDKTIPLR